MRIFSIDFVQSNKKIKLKDTFTFFRFYLHLDFMLKNFRTHAR